MFRREKVEDEISKEEKKPQKHVDMSFKEGQTIKINIGVILFISFLFQNIGQIFIHVLFFLIRFSVSLTIVS